MFGDHDPLTSIIIVCGIILGDFLLLCGGVSAKFI
nr:MAG TPA: Protein of unknown function (DUF2897) [Caudoviricetes sp.]